VKEGLFKVAYHVGIEGVVKNEPIKPANWQINTLTTSFKISMTPILISFHQL
jgi:hypothetical protein